MNLYEGESLKEKLVRYMRTLFCMLPKGWDDDMEKSYQKFSKDPEFY